MARNDYSECFTRPSPWVLRWKHLLPRQGEVLDVACGPGRHTALLALEGRRVLACDIDLTGVEWVSRPLTHVQGSRGRALAMGGGAFCGDRRDELPAQAALSALLG